MNDTSSSDMLGTEIMRLANLPRIQRHDDLAEEYSIRLDPDALSGLIVYGLFRGEWTANPSLRPVVRELLVRLAMIPE